MSSNCALVRWRRCCVKSGWKCTFFGSTGCGRFIGWCQRLRKLEGWSVNADSDFCPATDSAPTSMAVSRQQSRVCPEFGPGTPLEIQAGPLMPYLRFHPIVSSRTFPDADLAGLLAASYVTMHPAHEEDIGLAVAEGQALGVPTIAFAAVGPAAIIQDGQTGWLVPVGDQGQLTLALGAALDQPGETARRGTRARTDCLRRCGVESHVRLTEAAYRLVLAKSCGEWVRRNGKSRWTCSQGANTPPL
jgi:glycosyltransferase involved in cell wall biosynthesis